MYIRNKEPMIADRDIVVLKYLKKDGGIYRTPIQGIPVTLGKMMVAQPDTPCIEYEFRDLYGRGVFSIGGGVIHAMLGESNEYGNYCAKAIIPKGTEYWVDQLGKKITAEQLFITEEEGTDGDVDTQLFKEILESAPEKNGIRVGDYQMTDNSFVHPTGKFDKENVRGTVCGFYEDGTPMICALEAFVEVWDTDNNSRIGEGISWDIALKLFNGREITDQYKKQVNDKDKERFGAFERCINYRKDKGEEWYFGSLGETMVMLDNAEYLNAAHKITGLGFVSKTQYWTCSEMYVNSTCWRLVDMGGVVNVDCNIKYLFSNVVPFYKYNIQ